MVTALATIVAGITIAPGAIAATSEPLRFDFGPGTVAAGYTGVGADAAYSTAAGYGFGDTSLVTGVDRGGADPIRSDFVQLGATDFRIDLPNGDYVVSLVAGDSAGTSEIGITAESMPKVTPVAQASGKFLQTEFPVSLVDGQLDLVFSGGEAKLNSLVITESPKRTAAENPTVFIASDSTVQDYTDAYEPQAGWGQMLPRYLDDDITVANKAIGGRSSKNFINQGRLDEILRTIAPQDYLFVQFGHNDASAGIDDRYASPADYKEYLRTYVHGARQRGAIPVLVTPVTRRQFDANGNFTPAFPEYVAKMKELASEENVALIDLSAASVNYLQGIGAEASKSVFLWVDAGVYPGRPNGTQDDTHFQDYGAIQMAKLVAHGIASLDIPLASRLNEPKTPEAVPSTPTNLKASNISNSGVQLRWTASDTADIYRIYRKLASEPDSAYQFVRSATIAQSNVGGMSEGKTYDFRLVGVNDKGQSATSESIPVRTKSALFKFDFQPAGAPVAAGFTEVNTSMVYTSQRGWGVKTSAGLGDRDRGAADGADDLQRDFILGNAEFMVDLPNGSYSVTTHSGDWIGTTKTDFTMEGKSVGSGNAGKGQVTVKETSPVDVTDGQLNIAVSGAGARLNGIEITSLSAAPDAPTDLVNTSVSIAPDGSATVGLSWTDDADSASYQVYRVNTEGGAPESVGRSDEKKFVDTTATAGVEYDYTVTALDSAGLESEKSKPTRVSVTDPDVATVAAPNAVVVTGSSAGSTSLVWTKVTGAKHYAVYRSDSATDGFAFIGITADADYTDSTSDTTTAHYYRVASINAGGKSEQSTVFATTAIFAEIPAA